MTSTEPERTESTTTTTTNTITQDSTERTLSPSQSQSQSPSHEPKPSDSDQNQPDTTPSRPHRPRKQIHTHHCRFCSHLLLATTRDISLLHRRREPAQDAAFILPISSPSGDGEGSDSESEANGGGKETNYTILLSTLLPDRKHTIIRRADGFEKRLLLRCGRCRVVIGYFLDNVHFRQRKGQGGAADAKSDGGREEGEKKGDDDEAKVVYLLPGSLVRTEQLDVNAEDVELKLESDREWRAWLKGER
ncbi:hypothetical protein C8Q69DRAFT_502097 [Paecilomyces variotii]|uniref:STEEP1 domain-containing protein n=1 Tax=Byssochlamys spectabilis TaxID=264951 RepID=A0A443HI75_BYSSP|nr:hypothetical protein C8Q69DRAFT_502097 [Paecilomyces variotii]KAJ9364753.1 hypothetical protein DTO280E4_1048 [Paecilomyces variotii]RWQ91467.1 hypothetical protein C8Q69DRAFT_502097 [Paecilomyces variotii]